jgi:outer membrane receptor protein involved in Fe transport
MGKNLFSIVFILLFVVLISNTVAQTTGKIVGKILDGETNEPVAGANVLLLDTRMGASTDLDGDFMILNVVPGTYSLEIQMIGYNTIRNEGLVVSVNRTTSTTISITPTLLESEVIVVTAEKVAIKRDQTSSIRNVSADDIKILPVDFTQQIVELQPGVVGNHFRGGRGNEVAYMIDGVMVTEALYRTDQMVEVTPNAVEDMEVITGVFNAEYGNAMSGIVNVITKEGGNKIEGAASVNVGNYVTSHSDVYVGLEETGTPHIQDYKLGLSGPVITDNLNFIIDGRFFSDTGYLNGINRFNVDDYSDFREYPKPEYISEANGDESIVPLNDREEVYLLGKLSFRPITALKASLIYTYNDTKGQGYSHGNFYNPYGVGTYQNKSQMFALHINHMLSTKAFYELKLSHINYERGNYLFEDPLDPRYVHDFYGSGTGPWFSTGGQSKNHSTGTEATSRIKLDLTWQFHKSHALKAGIDGSKVWLDQNNINIRNEYEGTDLEALYTEDPITGKRTYPYYAPEIRANNSVYTDRYKKEPIYFAAYAQDKMEFQDMVVNFGVRFDWFDPNTVYPTDWRNPGNQDYFEDKSRMSDYPKADPQYQFSPRFGLAYEVGKTALLRFSYGHFMQVPPLNYYYQNSKFLVTDLGTAMGNPNLKAQKTIQYEVGLWLQLTRDMDFEVAVYYRDIYDLLSSKLVYSYSQLRFGVYDNKDYGNARGIELKYQARLSDFTFNANYTLQYTRGVADTPDLAYNRAGQDQDPVNKLIPLEWDQRHTFNLTTAYNTRNFGLTFLFLYHSGRPYSWQPITESPLAFINLLPNNQERPSQFRVDLTAFYNLFTFSNIDVRLTLLAYNIFDNLNENSVNSTTGRAYTGIVRPVNLAIYKSDFSEYSEQFQNPGMYAAPRSIRLGLGFQF